MLEVLSAALDGTGPAILPLDPALPPAALAASIAAFAPAAIETPAGLERLPAAGASRGAGAALPPEVAVVIATSGSTGQPKGVQLTAAALLASAHASLHRIGARPGDRWLCCLPAFHVAGLQVLVRSLVSGQAPVVSERLDQATLAAAVAQDCQYASLVPTQLSRLSGAAELAGFRAILLGGAAPPAGQLEAARSAGARVVTTYGMTETCGGCVYDGMPLDGVSVELDEEDRIRLSGPVLFSGYRFQPELTRQVLRDGWFATSDLGNLSADGRLTVRGRSDGVINSGGRKVVPGEVEAALDGCAGVQAVVVVGVPHPEWGEIVTAVVVPSDPADPPTLAQLRARAQLSLPAWAAPHALVLQQELPLLRSGKPDREAARLLAAADG
jgi:O-succinylbenzoic acid--CoA ligase